MTDQEGACSADVGVVGAQFLSNTPVAGCECDALISQEPGSKMRKKVGRDAIARHDQAGNVDNVMGSRLEAGSVKARQVHPRTE